MLLFFYIKTLWGIALSLRSMLMFYFFRMFLKLIDNRWDEQIRNYTENVIWNVNNNTLNAKGEIQTI